ncbi:hypothetical protein [Metabacillus malikii]|uniref:Flagellar hook-length control protein FliK n=1 Tax=Metabacillus malikii TaxID=1504265 RepID=A0ABT9ZE70_9BACI|nr:hypothetical protein [Metabacillus malikii]MDQ0230551.1 hypothetical protein [Metabacillus malikii]
MEQTTVLSALFKQAMSQIPNAENQLTLKENQVVLGNVLKLFPNQKALIQVGQTSLIAQLETAIEANENYWFTVKGSTDTGLQLKMMKKLHGETNNEMNTAKQLLSMFQIRATKQNLAFINQVMDENVPITKKQIQASTDILTVLPKDMTDDAIDAIVTAVKKDYPLTENIIKSILASQSSKPLVEQIESLLSELQHVKNKTAIQNILTNQLKNVTQQQSELLVKTIIELLNNPIEMKTITTSEQQLITQINTKLSKLDNNQVQQVLFDTIQFNLGEKHKNVTPHFFTFEEMETIGKIATNASLFTNKDEVIQLFKAIEANIGLKDELLLWKKLSTGENIDDLHSLKNNLITVSGDTVPPLLKEQIDQLILRLNGQPLLQNENGPIQQFITQIPLFMLNHQTDLTIQWTGKKRADGKIDPDYCRIVFYLQLPKLNDIMIDVQNQNRIMSITIKNDHPTLSTLVNRASTDLKEALKTMNYHVSSIQVKPFVETPMIDEQRVLKSGTKEYPFSYMGVDLKI